MDWNHLNIQQINEWEGGLESPRYPTIEWTKDGLDQPPRDPTNKGIEGDVGPPPDPTNLEGNNGGFIADGLSASEVYLKEKMKGGKKKKRKRRIKECGL